MEKIIGLLDEVAEELEARGEKELTGDLDLISAALEVIEGRVNVPKAIAKSYNEMEQLASKLMSRAQLLQLHKDKFLETFIKSQYVFISSPNELIREKFFNLCSRWILFSYSSFMT